MPLMNSASNHDASLLESIQRRVIWLVCSASPLCQSRASRYEPDEGGWSSGVVRLGRHDHDDAFLSVHAVLVI